MSRAMKEKRAYWIGDVLGEKRTYGDSAGNPAFWNGVALYTQRAIIQESKAVTLKAVGEDLGEANESKVKRKVNAVTFTEADRTIVVRHGVITIPAAACSKPTSFYMTGW